ncbi:MAG: hypothetical protein ACQESP_02960 [Candidatus Muiribacteriota bacterium]
MNKIKFFSIIITLVLLSGCWGDFQRINDLEKKNLKGPVKQINESVYEAISPYGVVEKGELKEKALYKFNEDGFMTLYSRLDVKEDEIIEKVTYEYDFRTHNNRGKLAGADYDKDDTVLSEFKYEHDDKGRIIQKTRLYEPDRQRDRKIYKYNRRNQVIKMHRFNSNDNLSAKYEYIYEDDNLVHEILARADDTITSEFYNEYDEKNNLIKQTEYELNERLRFIREYNYDEKNNMINLTVFDHRNNIVKNLTYEYEYSDNGNWIKATVKDKGEPIKIIERKIEFYPQKSEQSN